MPSPPPRSSGISSMSADDSSSTRLLPRCPQCDYDLTGLPDEGRCPECGYTYTRSHVLLHGHRVVIKGTPMVGVSVALFCLAFICLTQGWLALSTTFVLAASLLLAWVLFQHIVVGQRVHAPVDLSLMVSVSALLLWNAFMWMRWGSLIQSKLFFLAGVPLLAWAIYHRIVIGPRAKLDRLVVCREGVSIRLGPGPADLIPWSRIKRYGMTRRFPYRLTWTRPVPCAWHVAFSSGVIFQYIHPTIRETRAQGRGGVYIDLLFNADGALAERIDAHIQKLFDEQRSPAGRG